MDVKAKLLVIFRREERFYHFFFNFYFLHQALT